MSNGRIAVLCPSRGRPDLALEAYKSVVSTSSSADVFMPIEEDQQDAYSALYGLPRLSISVHGRSPATVRINDAARRASGYEVMCGFVDDARFETPAWDAWTLETIRSFPGHIGVVMAHHNGDPGGGFPFVSGRWVSAIGFMADPEMKQFCWDTATEIMGASTNVVYASQDQLSIYHRHEVGDDREAIFAEDAIRFLGWCGTKRRLAVERLLEASG